MKLSRINILITGAIALALGASTDTFAKNSPIYPQFQSNGGTAYAAGTKDGGGSLPEVDRIATDGFRHPVASHVASDPKNPPTGFRSHSTLFVPSGYLVFPLDFYATIIELKFTHFQIQPKYQTGR